MNIINANALAIPLPAGCVQTVVTSPPYWGLRDYGVSNQVGLEKTPDCLGWATGKPCGECYVCHMVAVFREVRRVMREDATLWLNLGDSYCANSTGSDSNSSTLGGGKATQREALKRPDKAGDGLKPKDLIGIPWRVALALQADGWWLRSDIIWAKPNPMPESVTDRPTKAHEYIFMLTKAARYYFDQEAVKEDGVQYEIERRTKEYEKGLNTKHVISSDGKTGQEPQSEHGAVKDLRHRQELIMAGRRNIRTVWTITTQPTSEAHFATYPEALVERCIKAGSQMGDLVFDPFIGSGTTGRVAIQLARRFIGTELKFDYIHEIARKRTSNLQPIILEIKP